MEAIGHRFVPRVNSHIYIPAFRGVIAGFLVLSGRMVSGILAALLAVRRSIVHWNLGSIKEDAFTVQPGVIIRNFAFKLAFFRL
jgi:hypothetical protein